MSILLILAVVLLVSGKVYEPRKTLNRRAMFEEYNAFWNKTHASPAHKQARYLNFLENDRKITELNRNSRSAKFGFTQFSDMSLPEFKRSMLGLKQKMRVASVEKVDIGKVGIPTGNIDWAAKGMITAIKNQEQCGSCWAFSATETVESANLIAGKSVPNLSPQEIVDCDTNDDGCNGGDPQEALQWIQQQGGQETNACYPYTAQDGQCMESQCTPVLTVTSVQGVNGGEPGIYSQLQAAPLSICCDAEPWQNYQGGILDADQCGDSVDHAIQLTGYQQSQGGYWVVRNSWGQSWGENGFIWLQYGYDTCAITSEVTYATA